MSAAPQIDALSRMVQQAQSGDRAAVDRLVREHEGWVRSVIFGVIGRRDTMDDIAQQVWTQVVQRLHTLESPGRLRAWLYSIARHAAIDYGMAEKRRAKRSGSSAPLRDAADERATASPVQTTARRELRDALMDAIQGLPAIYREPFVLRHLENWSYAEIGELMKMPLDTVETRLVRARRLLREALVGKV